MEDKKTLFALTTQMTDIERMLDENGGEITPELEALWAETKESLKEKADSYNTVIRKYEAFIKAADDEIAHYEDMKKKAENSLRHIKEHIRDTMAFNGIDRIEGRFCKIRLLRSIATEVDEEAVLQPYRAKLEKLAEALPSWVTANLKVSKSELRRVFKDSDVKPAGVDFVTNTSIIIK